MNLLDRLLSHDSWTTKMLLERCDELDDAALDRTFDIGHKTIRATLHHLIHNMEIWSLLMAGEVVVPEQDNSLAGMKQRLGAAALRLAAVAQDVASRGTWDDEWLDSFEDPPRMKSFGTSIAHIITHSMHHRAQLLYMLRLAGVNSLPDGDVFSWEESSPDNALDSE